MLSALYAVVVCLCVRHTSAEHRITQIMPHDSPGTLVFTAKFELQVGWGGLKSATFDEKCAISRKRYKIDALFLTKSNRKSYMLSNGYVADDLG